MSPLNEPHTVEIGDVARALRLSCQGVRRLDSILNPLRTSGGRRLYRWSDVNAYLARRDGARAARSRP